MEDHWENDVSRLWLCNWFYMERMDGIDIGFNSSGGIAIGRL